MSGPLDPFGNAVTEVAKAVTGAENRKALQEASKGTPAMDLAGQMYARNLGIRQQAIFALYQPLRWFRLVPDKYFEEQFWDDLATKLQDVPEDERQTPRLSIAGPAMEGLAYSIDEPDLREMYLNLLAGASNTEKAPKVHPSFVEIIRQLSAQEVPILEVALSQPHMMAIRLRDKSLSASTSHLEQTCVLSLARDGEPMVFDELPIWVDNWQRLGLVNLTFTEWLSSPDDGTDAYGWAKERPEYQSLVTELEESGLSETREAAYDRGILRTTPLGQRFHEVVSQPN